MLRGRQTKVPTPGKNRKVAAFGAFCYGRGLFGWQEGGFRTPVELAIIAEGLAVIGLAAALALRRDSAQPR